MLLQWDCGFDYFGPSWALQLSLGSSAHVGWLIHLFFLLEVSQYVSHGPVHALLIGPGKSLILSFKISKLYRMSSSSETFSKTSNFDPFPVRPLSVESSEVSNFRTICG